MAKLLTQRAVLEIADSDPADPRRLRLDPEYGSSAVRDARLGPIGGGTDEVMKEIIGEDDGAVAFAEGEIEAEGTMAGRRVRVLDRRGDVDGRGTCSRRPPPHTRRACSSC